MGKWFHRNYLSFLLLLTLTSGIVIAINGFSYYTAPLKEKAFHSKHEDLKPSGKIGHGLGIVGTSMVIIGVVSYSSRKRLRLLSMAGNIRDWLNFHIFLCLTGPVLILFHTTFKFTGIAGVSMWSMIAVVLSGVIGRFIYIQIPRGIKGNELTSFEIEEMRREIQNEIILNFPEINKQVLGEIDMILQFEKPKTLSFFSLVLLVLIDDLFIRRKKFYVVEKTLKTSGLPSKEIRKLLKLERQRYILMRKIALLDTFKQVFKYWHVIHLPFTLIMFILLFIHVIVALTLGYKWVF